MREFWRAVLGFFQENETALRILLILVVAAIILWVLRVALRRGVDRFVNGVKKKQQVATTQEISTSGIVRERAIQRTRTLAAVGRSIITWVVVAVALVLVLHQVGIDLTAILASAGFIGAGLAFGAQSLVKDILNGIFMVIEDQLGVGDWVSLGTIEGTVEDVGIRVTQVRATDGTLWFVRNGEILQLGNSSQGFGQAVIDVTVDGEADLAQVQTEALAAADTVMQDPKYRRKITGRPQVWGLQSVFGDRATWRFTLRTRPEQQWEVQRAIRLEIKRRFRAAGIHLSKQLPDFPAHP